MNLSLFIVSVLFTLPLFGIKNPDGFVSLKECQKQHVPVTVFLQEKNSSQFVLRLKHGVVVNEGAIVTKEGKILRDTETYQKDQSHLLRKKRDITKENPRYFAGRLVVLSSPGQENWYHWLLQVLPRLKILASSGIKYDKIYIDNLRTQWQKKSLEIVLKKLGIAKECLYLVEGDAVVEAKELIVPSIAHRPSMGYTYGSFPRWLKQFLYDCFLPKTYKNEKISQPKKIYICRSKASIRRILNEEALIDKLKRKGFKAVYLEELSPIEQARLFHHADVICGPHGSGFANLIFCRPTTRVIEIDHGLHGEEQRSYYKRMAELMHCSYHPFYADLVKEGDLEKDITVDLQAFMKAHF